jgi:hypothetical protein
VTVQVAWRNQINTAIGPVPYLLNTTLFENVTQTYLPLMWFERVRGYWLIPWTTPSLIVYGTVLVSCRVVSSRLVSSRLVSSRLVSCRVVSCRVVSCRVVSCRVVQTGVASKADASRITGKVYVVQDLKVRRVTLSDTVHISYSHLVWVCAAGVLGYWHHRNNRFLPCCIVRPVENWKVRGDCVAARCSPVDSCHPPCSRCTHARLYCTGCRRPLRKACH